jgi:hypothetical protein
MALDGGLRFIADVELKQRRSRDAAFLVCEDRRLRGWRLGPRSGMPRWRLTAISVSGRNGIGFGRRGATQHGRREGGHGHRGCDVDARTVVYCGRWLSRTEARRFAEGSNGCFSTSLRQANVRRTRAGTSRGTERCPQTHLSGRRMTPTVALQLASVNAASCRWPSGALSRVTRW